MGIIRAYYIYYSVPILKNKNNTFYKIVYKENTVNWLKISSLDSDIGYAFNFNLKTVF